MTRARRLRVLALVLAAEAALWAALRASDLRVQAERTASAPPPSPSAGTPPAAEERPWTPPPDPFMTVRRLAVDSAEALAKWEQKVFRGKTSYEIMRGEEGAFLRASSRAASSGLFMKIGMAVDPNLVLSWRWRAREFPGKPRPEALADRAQDDFAARIYAIFPAGGLFNTDVIEYIWDERLPEGTVAASPFSGKVKLYVIRSGPTGADGWRYEERNLYEDYRRLFGKRPERPLGAVALMSDSDNTGTGSAADFADVVLKRRIMLSDNRP